MSHASRNRRFRALGLGFALTLASAAPAKPAAFTAADVPPQNGAGPFWRGPSFDWGGYAYPAAGSNGGLYRPTAYTAADLYIRLPGPAGYPSPR
jgi:hypothetical protein